VASTLAFNTALTQIEQALHRVIRWKLLTVTATVADVPTLRAYATQSSSGNALPEFTAVFVTSIGFRVEWVSSSTAADDGATVFQPTDVAAGIRGRWLITSSTSTSGYLAAVNYWQGETKKSEFKQRILAVTPSVAILWESSDNDPRSTVPGAIYDYPCRFSLWCVDSNLRDHYEAMLGSAYSYDTAHPGAMQIVGDIKKLLADENKRLVAGTSTSNALDFAGGVKLITLGGEDVEDADLAERWIVLSLGIEVIGSVENPDASSDHVAVTSVYVQPNLTELHAQSKFDSANYVVSGYLFSAQSGFTQTPTSGSAVVASLAVASAPAPHTFSAQSDTYCDLKPDGTLVYLVTQNGGAVPAATAGALRLGVVITDSLGITQYQPIAANSAAWGSSNKVIPHPNVQ
jgi:hypothetical protein